MSEEVHRRTYVPFVRLWTFFVFATCSRRHSTSLEQVLDMQKGPRNDASRQPSSSSRIPSQSLVIFFPQFHQKFAVRMVGFSAFGIWYRWRFSCVKRRRVQHRLAGLEGHAASASRFHCFVRISAHQYQIGARFPLLGGWTSVEMLVLALCKRVLFYGQYVCLSFLQEGCMLYSVRRSDT